MKLLKTGKVLRHGETEASEAIDYSEAIASALRAELGDTHRAVKTVMKWTGASERAVKNWLSGESGPHGRYLVKILRYSDGALQTILAASRRLDLLAHLLKENQSEASVLNRRKLDTTPPDAGGYFPISRDGPNLDPNHDPKNDPDHDDELGLNPRQKWFLSELSKKPRIRADSIQRFFNVSQKTSKRDIAALKAKGLLHFVGSRRRGRYVLSIAPLQQSNGSV